MSLPQLFAKTETFLSAVPADHGWTHARKVVVNAAHALMEEADPTRDEFEEVIAAALLHDVDDRKFFQTEDYQNARTLLAEAGYAPARIERVVKMISYVSASSSGNNMPEGAKKWQLIPRDSDRVEAIGHIGVERCYAYTRAQKRPVALAKTPRVTSAEALAAVDCPARFRQYVNSVSAARSESMIDHFYDKLLAISELTSGNGHLQQVARERHQIMVRWLFAFCRAHPEGEVLDLEAGELERHHA
jgi:uncharacterized protein